MKILELFSYLTEISVLGITIALIVWLSKLLASKAIEKKYGASLNSVISDRQDKVDAYKALVENISVFLANLDTYNQGVIAKNEVYDELSKFTQERFKIYGLLALLAPQQVMDAQDKLFDYILSASQEHMPYDWQYVRTLTLGLLNEMRKDIGFENKPIHYSGKF